MWTSSKVDHVSYLDQCFNELVQECRHAAPGARLSYMLRNRLEKLTMEERKSIVGRLYDHTSAPLFISCKRGNVEIVDYLIVKCGADIEQKGFYEVSDDRSVHYVTPLWCAAVSGRLEVVKCLVRHNADVNNISDTGSTPVRSACFMTHFDIVQFLVENGADIVKPNYNGGTCLINSVQSTQLCGYLLENGANVNAQDIQMKTALHYAIQEHRLETMQLLIEHDADPFIKNRYGDDALQTACLKGAIQIFEYLVHRLHYPPERVADAYELLGSTFLDDHFDLSLTKKMWRDAIQLRLDHNIPKVIMEQSNLTFLDMKEFQTIDELEALDNDLDAMRMQSLLVSERVLGIMHKEMIFRLMYRGAAYADSLQYKRCIDLWKYAFELRIRKDTLLHNEASFAGHALVRLFLDLSDKGTQPSSDEQLQYRDVYETVDMVVREFPNCQRLLKIRPVFKKQIENFDKLLKILTYLIYILNHHSKTQQEEYETHMLMKRLRAMNPRSSNGDTLLHLVLSKTNTMKSSIVEQNYSSVFPHPSVCQLLLQAGFSIDAVNHSLETPLHIISSLQNFNEEIVKILLANGAHIDQKDCTGNQPCRRLRAIGKCTINTLDYLSLKCLAATKIRLYNIPFSNKVPADLVDFVNLH